jgi:hypothetical protein
MKLEEKALLAKLAISVWEGKKKDKGVELKVDEMYKSVNAGSFRKTLLASPELSNIGSFANKARDIHNTLTLPWNGDGTGILNIELHNDYVKKMRQCRDDFFDAVNAFSVVYSDQKEKDKTRLGGLYNHKDYPLWAELSLKFRFEIFFLPLPSKEDFRIQLQSDEVEKIRSEFETHFKRVFNEATKDLYRRLYEVIQHLYERLEDKKAVFRDSLITNIAELVQILPKLNITGDEKLIELTKLAEEELAGLDPQDLRDSKELREVTADLAGEMLKEMESVL